MRFTRSLRPLRLLQTSGFRVFLRQALACLEALGSSQRIYSEWDLSAPCWCFRSSCGNLPSGVQDVQQVLTMHAALLPTTASHFDRCSSERRASTPARLRAVLALLYSLNIAVAYLLMLVRFLHAHTGYLNRRACKIMADLKLQYNGTVADNAMLSSYGMSN